MTTLQIDKLSRAEKLQTMEALWEALSKSDGGFESPLWHQDSLKETEARKIAGQEPMTDWETAKRQLRKRFE